MKRTFNDFRRITRSQTVAAAAVTKDLQTPPPLKRLKIELPSYRGFDVLPNELVGLIVECLPPNLDTITMMVCKRWKGVIGRRLRRHNPLQVLYWAMKNQHMPMLKWVADRVDVKRFSDMFRVLANYFITTANLGGLKWICKKAGTKQLLTRRRSIEQACRHGDLAFLKAVMKLYMKDVNEQYRQKDLFDYGHLNVVCASGDLEKAQWILETDGMNQPLLFFRLLWASEAAFDHGHLPILKWFYDMITSKDIRHMLSSENARLEWLKRLRERPDSRPCSSEIQQWLAAQ